MNPDLIVDNALRRYITFYRIVASNINKVVIGRFEDVTSDYGRVIQNINDKFHTEFDLFNHTVEEKNIVFEKIKEICIKQNLAEIQSIAIPMEVRDKEKSNIKLVYRKNLMHDAVCIYEDIINK